jgi:cellobiose-specific phosphotransferase system component IIA
MVAEMKPLLALAREKEVDIGESKTLIDDAAVAGRERQIDKAIELVQNARTILLTKIDSHLASLIMRLNDEIKVARDFGGDISRASTYIQEVARARSAGDVEAAYVYIDKIEKEMQPITGRYNDSRKKITSLKQFIADCEIFIVDTREARKLLLEANRAFEAKDFDKVDSVVKTANESLYKNIPARMNEEMKKAKDELLEAKVRNVNITPMLTVLKSATNLMKSGDYGQAIKEMREFKDMLKKP